MNKDYWLSTATGQIPFPPDRDAVRRELAAHLEDRQEAIQARGMTAYEAEQAATAAMGDPEPLARELARLHRPWWGYLWRASRWAVILLLLVALPTLLPALRDLFFPEYPTEHYRPQLPEAVEVWTHADGAQRTDTLLQSWTPEGSVSLGGYRFTAPLAYLKYRDFAPVSGDPQADYELTIVLRASSWRFWEPISASQYMILDHAARDSDGSLYGRWEKDLFSPDTHRSYFCKTRSNSPFAVYYEVYLDLSGPEAPAWVEIPVGYGGQVRRVDLEREVLS